MKDINHVDKRLGRNNSPLLTFLMGIILLVAGSCKEEEITPSSKLDFSASGPAATADNPAVATADQPVNMSWTEKSSYTDYNGSIVDCTPRATFHLGVSKTIVKAKTIEELIAMKESLSRDKSGSDPVRHQISQTFEIGEQTVSFDMSYEVYSYKNAHQEVVDMPYVKLNPVQYGEAKPTDNPDDEGHPVVSSVTSVRIRPAHQTRGSVIIENLYDVTVTFNMASETVGDPQSTKKTYSFEVKYQAWVESLYEFPDPKTTFDYSFGVVGGTASKESPFVVNPGEKMELEWKGQSRHTWFDVSEMEQKLTINASLTKQLTGNNRITARFLHENSFEFQLQAKIFIDTNHLPNVTDQTLFESGRLLIIPFNRHFEEHEQDKGLKTTLSDPAALSGILNWAVEGYRLFKEEGLEPPEDVKTATAQYRQDSDRISQFIDSWLEEGKDEDGDKYQVPCKAAYRVYARWCEEMNYRPDNYKNFRAAMEKAYMVDTRRPKGGGEKTPLIIGVRLRKEEVGAEDEDQDAFVPLADEDCKV